MVHLNMEFLHVRKEHVSAENAAKKKAHQQQQSEALNWPAAVEPFGAQVGERNPGAPQLDVKVTFQKDLRRHAIIRWRDHSGHFV